MTKNHKSNIAPPIINGIVYFMVVFGIAFVLGAIRTTLLVPHVGELIAVIIECPIILLVSWNVMIRIVVARRAKRSKYATKTKATPTDGIIMGIVAFIFLMIAELLLSIVAFNKTATEFVNEIFTSTPNLIGFIAQIAFGLFPLIEYYYCRSSDDHESKRHD